jgi:hypothetical protein
VKYQIDITRDVTEVATVLIEAGSEEAAIALAKLRVSSGKVDFERASVQHVDYDAWELGAFDETPD